MTFEKMTATEARNLRKLPKAKKTKPSETANRITANIIRATNLQTGCVAYRINNVSGPFKPNGCGTNGCAVGEFPAIWPDLWSWNLFPKRHSLIYRPTGEHTIYSEAAEDFLSIDRNVRQFLFTAADAINSDNPNGLPPTATAQEVADHIETWCNENEKA